MSRGKPLQRKPFKRAEGPTAPKEERPRARSTPQCRPCKHCRIRFQPLRPGQEIHEDCAEPYALSLIAKRQAQQKAAREKAAKAERAADKVKGLEFKKPSYFRGKAQDSFNAYIRLRDAHLGCVSCATTNPPMLPGGQWDAGHFLSRGAYPEKAFNEDNCHKQCKPCNAGSGRFSAKARTVIEKFEAELLIRIGPERLAAVRAPHPPLHYTREDFEAIEAHYKRKTKELKEKAE